MQELRNSISVESNNSKSEGFNDIIKATGGEERGCMEVYVLTEDELVEK